MKISVALCTYNGESYLDDQLASLLAQDRQPDELVVCDDVSTDSTISLLTDFAGRAPFRVRIERNESNLGSTANFGRAIDLCAGDLIFLCDQDDIWKPDKISRMAAVFEERPEIGMVFTNAELADSELRPIGMNLWDKTFPKKDRVESDRAAFAKVLVGHNVVTGATMAFRTELRESFMPIPTNIPNMIHDAWIALNAVAVSDYLFIDENLVSYRQHPGQQLGVDFRPTKLQSKSEKTSHYQRWIKYYEDEVRRCEILSGLIDGSEHLRKFISASDIGSMIADKQSRVLHLRNRLDMPRSRFRRVGPVLRELFSGRYARYSKGFLSAIKDISE